MISAFPHSGPYSPFLGSKLKGNPRDRKPKDKGKLFLAPDPLRDFPESIIPPQHLWKTSEREVSRSVGRPFPKKPYYPSALIWHLWRLSSHVKCPPSPTRRPVLSIQSPLCHPSFFVLDEREAALWRITFSFPPQKSFPYVVRRTSFTYLSAI